MDQQAFEAAVRTHSADLFRFAYWLSRNRATAQDLVQDAFMAAWKARESLREPSMVKSWLFAILRNEYARGFQRKRLDLADDQDLDELAWTGAVSGQERVELHDLLHALPESYREPLVLQVLGGFSGKEIADLLGITEQNVMVRLTRARQALRRLAAPDAEHEEKVA
jgi:RNA polymerase sigma-70 factor (ECF subfamily)